MLLTNWVNVMPGENIEHAIQRAEQRALPVIAEPQPIETVGVLLRRGENAELSAAVSEARNFLASRTLTTYDLTQLTPSEMQGLVACMQKFEEMSPLQRMRLLEPFVRIYLPNWERLSAAEKDALKYARHRDLDETKWVTADNVERVARICLRCMDGKLPNEDFRPPYSLSDHGKGGFAATLRAESYLIQEVHPVRDAHYSGVVGMTLEEFLRFHERVRQALTDEEMKQWGLNKGIGLLRSIKSYNDKFGTLTHRQRKAVYDAMRQYGTTIAVLPGELSDRIREGAVIPRITAPIDEGQTVYSSIFADMEERKLGSALKYAVMKIVGKDKLPPGTWGIPRQVPVEHFREFLKLAFDEARYLTPEAESRIYGNRTPGFVKEKLGPAMLMLESILQELSVSKYAALTQQVVANGQ